MTDAATSPSATARRPALTRWQFPDLDEPAHPTTPDGAGKAIVDNRVPAPAECAASASATEPAAAVAVSIAEACAEAAARGYEEGLARGIEEGREKGYAEGFAEGSEEARDALAQEAQRIASVVQRLRAPLPAVEGVVEDALIALALETARSVIGGEIARSRESLVRLIREALTKAPIRIAGLRIALNPADLDIVRGLAPELAASDAILVGDAAVEAGGCLISVGDDGPIKDRRWQPRGADGVSQIDLSLAARWRSAMLTLFDGEGR